MKYPNGSPAVSKEELLRLATGIDGAEETIRKRLAGNYPIPDDVAKRIQSALKISPEEWRSITLRTADLPQAVLTHFFTSLRVQGLRQSIAFFPEYADDQNLESLCVPVRVIEDAEWRMYARNDPDESASLPDSVARNAVGISFEGWLRRAHQRVVLKGEPGEGKTTALWLHVSALCRDWTKRLDKNSPSADSKSPCPNVPLILHLGRIQPEPGACAVRLAIQNTLAIAETPLEWRDALAVWLENRVEKLEIQLILDGLDEADSDALANLRVPDGVPLVLATRYHADPTLLFRQFTTVRLVPLRWCLVDQFISGYFRGHGDGARLGSEVRAILRQNPSLRQAARNPLLLAVLCSIAGREDPAAIPQTRIGLLHAALLALLERGDSRRGFPNPRVSRNDQKVSILSEIAWHFYGEVPKPMPESELLGLLREILPNDSDPPAFFQELIDDGVLVRRGRGPARFLLRRIHELGVAAHLASELVPMEHEIAVGRIRGPGSGWKKGDFHPLNHPGWTEIWPLVAGCPLPSGALMDALELEWRTHDDLTRSRTALFAQTLGEHLLAGGHPPTDETLKELIGTILDFASKTDSVRGSPARWFSIAARLPPDSVIREILHLIRSGRLDLSQFQRIARCLGEIGTQSAQLVLQWIWRDDSTPEPLLRSVAEALGLVGTDSARNILLERLANPTSVPPLLQLSCVWGLGSIGDDASLQRVASLLCDSTIQEEVRAGCVDQGEHLFGPTIETALLELFDEVRSNLKGAVSFHRMILRTLARIGSPQTARHLLPLLSDPKFERLHIFMFATVGRTADIEGIESLHKLASDQTLPQTTRAMATVALARIRPDWPLQQIRKHIASWPEAVRLEAIATCREIPGPESLDIAIDRLLEDPSDDVCLAAAMAVGARAGVATYPALLKAMETCRTAEVFRVCHLALVADGQLDTADVRRKEFVHEIDTVDVAIRQARSATEGEKGRTRLREHFDQTKDSTTRTIIGIAMIELCQQTGWRPLVKGGWESP